MKENIKLFIKILLWIIAIFYFSCIILLSLFILKENKYGVTVINNKTYVIINDSNKNSTNKKGSLVIVKNMDINSLMVNDEVYVYESDKKNIVYVNTGIVESVHDNSEGLEPYVRLKDNNSYYRSEAIIGIPSKKISKIGGIIEYLERKWVFLLIVILPSALIALYEIVYIFKNFVFGYKKIEEE